MKTITVQVKEDHLENLARTKPMNALAELMWNALDAEATEVRVDFVENGMEGVEAVRVTDNGHGLHYDDALIVFQNLGGSWKRDGARTHARRRVLHGQYGKGRFRAFSLGGRVAWNTVYEEAGRRLGFTIDGEAAKLGQFNVHNAKVLSETAPGMIVEIANPYECVNLLRGVKALEEVTDAFALYLRHYPDVRIVYDGTPLDTANAEAHYRDYALDELVMQNGERVSAVLSVVEWSTPGKRGVYLCDAGGFMLHSGLPRLHFRGFSYTAYLKSDHLARLDREGLLQAKELSSDVTDLLDAARAKLREHFTLREAERAVDIVSDWKAQDLYPYEGEAKTDRDSTERRIFDIYATHLHQIFPDFAGGSARNKRLMLRLIQELVRSEPTRLARVLDEVVDFPEEKEGEILDLVSG